ncbi:hypothetical protein V8B97DRAFT_2015203 [Scleroderma yunnanense]
MSPVATSQLNATNTSHARKSTKSINSADSVHLSSADVIQMEHEYGAHNYHPLPVVFDSAKGAKVWDPEGKEYIDMLSAYSAVNQVCPVY